MLITDPVDVYLIEELERDDAALCQAEAAVEESEAALHATVLAAMKRRAARLRHRENRRRQLERMVEAGDFDGLATLGDTYARLGRIERAPDLLDTDRLIDVLVTADYGPALTVIEGRAA